MSTPSFPESVTGTNVEFGGCWDGNPEDEARCHLDKNGCVGVDVHGNEKPRFRSALQLRESGYKGGNLHCHARQITVQRGAPIERCDLLDMCQVGSCHGDGRTSKSSTDDCNLVQDQKANTATLFGACRDSRSEKMMGCFFSESDCLSGEQFLSPDQLFRHYYDEQPFCDCTMVLTGACTDDDFSSCALTAGQCGPDERFVTARELHDNPSKYNSLDCRLCRDGAVSESTMAETAKVVKFRRDTLAASSGRGGAVALAVILSLLAVGLVLAAAYWYKRNKASGIDKSMSSDQDIMGKPYRDTMDEEDDFANAEGGVGMTNIDLNTSDDDGILVVDRQLD